MRILMMCQYFPPAFGGIGRIVEDLSTALVAQGHHVAVVTLRNGNEPEYEIVNGVRVYRIAGTISRVARWLFADPGRVFAPPLPDPELARGIGRVITLEKPQIVHAHDWLVHSFLPLKHWSGARLVVSLHDYALVCAKWTLMHQGAICTGPRLAKCIGCGMSHFGRPRGIAVVLSSWLTCKIERRMVDLFLPVSQAAAAGNGLVSNESRCRVIPESVPEEPRFAPGSIEEHLGQLPAAEYILYVGALARNKGVDVLLDAYGRMRHPYPLVLIGYEVPGLPSLPDDLPDQVVVLRNWPHTAVMHAWRKSLFGVVPSVWKDPCPIVALEALTTSRAVVASRIGGLVDIVVDGENGLLVDPGDPEALQNAMELLSRDTGLRDRLGRAAEARAARFRTSTVVATVEKAYQEVLSQ